MDANESETVLTFIAREQRNAENAQHSADWVDNAVGLVEPSSSTAVVARFAGKRGRIPNAVSWVKIDITNTDGTKAADGMYYIRFNKGWLPREAVVEAGTSEIPFSHTGDQPCLMQPGMKLGTGGASLIKKSDLAKAQFITTPLETVNAVDAANKAPEAPREPPEAVLEALDEKQRAVSCVCGSGCYHSCTTFNSILIRRYGRRPISILSETCCVNTNIVFRVTVQT